MKEISNTDKNIAVKILLSKFQVKDLFDRRVLLHSLGVNKEKLESYSAKELDDCYKAIVVEYIDLVIKEGQENVVPNEDFLLVSQILSNQQTEKFNQLKEKYNE
jgi:hypothetical protein